MIQLIGCANLLVVFIICFRISSWFYKSILDRLLIASTLMWSGLILDALVLSCFKKLNSYGLYFAVSILIFLALYICLRKKGYCSSSSYSETNYAEHRIGSAIVIILICVIALLNLYTAIEYYPNNSDSMTYHLPRI